eukprot:scaffold8.g1686.t1
MVEGHQCHRLAHAHRSQLQGRAFEATSPNGRFAAGAAAIDGRTLARIEVHGKNLFYHFCAAGDPQQSPVVLHFHFGMSGKFSTHALPGPEPTPTTRLRLVDREAGLVAHLSAMTVQLGDLAFYHTKAAQLGQDPLREDADPEAVWAAVSCSKRAIGAEILFKAGVHPEQPGNTLSRDAFDRVWRHSVLLLQARLGLDPGSCAGDAAGRGLKRGFETGSILTVDPEEAAVLGKPWMRRYIYNQERCGRCGSGIHTWDMAALAALGLPTKGRKAELVARLQAAQAERAAEVEAALPAATDEATGERQEAAGDSATPTPKTPGLQRGPVLEVPVAAPYAAERTAGGRPQGGQRTARQRGGQHRSGSGGAAAAGQVGEAEVSPEVYAWDTTGQHPTLPVAKAEEAQEAARGAGGPVRRGQAAAGGVTPGTQAVLARGAAVATAQEAALEKAAAGEGRHVEHVALHDDASAAVPPAAAAARHVRRRTR